MSGGVERMMEGWSQEETKRTIPVKTHYQRMLDYRETILAEIERLNYHIKELEENDKLQKL